MLLSCGNRSSELQLINRFQRLINRFIHLSVYLFFYILNFSTLLSNFEMAKHWLIQLYSILNAKMLLMEYHIFSQYCLLTWYDFLYINCVCNNVHYSKKSIMVLAQSTMFLPQKHTEHISSVCKHDLMQCAFRRGTEGVGFFFFF